MAGNFMVGARNNLITFITVLCCSPLLFMTDAMALGHEDAIHLLNRTGFGVDLTLLPALKSRSREQAIEYLLERTNVTAATPLPQFQTVKPLRNRQQYNVDTQRLRDWWLHEMLTTSSPLTERMTLFWHGHFTSQLSKVKKPQLMLQQNVLMRQHGLGRFTDLLHLVIKDPAMLIYLDNNNSKKGNPNENFARELLELFTLGEGNYSEADVITAARAFTGWGVNRDMQFRFTDKRHDQGIKTFLNVEGKLGGNEIAHILLQQPRLAEFIVGKLWQEFVSNEPAVKTQQKLAHSFRRNGYNLKKLMQALLSTREFWSKAKHASMVKSPIELAVGTYRYLRLPVADISSLNERIGRMGQRLFEPPDVSGWPNGIYWVTSTSLLEREEFMNVVKRQLKKANRVRDGTAFSFALQEKNYIREYTSWQLAARRLEVTDLPLKLTPQPEHYIFNPVYQLK